MILFSGNTANEAWQQAYKAIRETKLTTIQPSRLGVTSEILHACINISNPRERWISIREPAINPSFAVAEFFWILRGSSDANFINNWFPNLHLYQGKGSQYVGAYGYRIKHNLGFDQLERAYQVLKNKPESRQVVIQIWDSKKDFPYENGESRSSDIPCNVSSLPKIRNNKLEWLQVLRSNDIFRGLPYNIVQFSLLQEVLAGWLNIEVASYNQISDSLHLYHHDLEVIGTNTNSQAMPENSDDIRLPKNEFHEVFNECINALDKLTDSSISEKSFLKHVYSLSLPISYQNMVTLALADIARRQNWQETKNETISLCKNPVLQYMWERWDTRTLKTLS